MSPRLLPDVTGRTLRVWTRNAAVYRKLWKISFIPPLVEPLLYILAFGIGLSGLVGSIAYRGTEVTYLEFIAPALLAVTVMNNAFFENTYASYVRMYYQRTFDAMMATPLSLDEIITGEILWGATKSLLAAAVMMVVIAPFGLLEYPTALLILPLSVLGGLAFGSMGMFFTAYMPDIEAFNLPVFLVITPMFLLSGTFFPLETLPVWAQKAAYVLPLTHLSDLARALGRGSLWDGLAARIAYLVLFTLLFYPMGLAGMRRRLIK